MCPTNLGPPRPSEEGTIVVFCGTECVCVWGGGGARHGTCSPHAHPPEPWVPTDPAPSQVCFLTLPTSAAVPSVASPPAMDGSGPAGSSLCLRVWASREDWGPQAPLSQMWKQPVPIAEDLSRKFHEKTLCVCLVDHKKC